HLLHAALRRILGAHVEQKGSLVEPERLRFDFSHSSAVTDEQLVGIERLVNDQIRGNLPVETALMSYPQALERGALALFGEKYGDQVRVLRMSDFSVELCGGTHVARTGDIGAFRMVSEAGVAAGVRRIEAVTGAAAIDLNLQNADALRKIAALLKSPADEVLSRVALLSERVRAQEKEIQQQKAKLAGSSGRDLAAAAVTIGEVKVLSQLIEDSDPAALREAMDRLKDRLKSAVIVLATVDGDQVRLVAGVTKELSKQANAGELANFVAGQIGGKGGGRPDLAQAGGTNIALLPVALASVHDWVRRKLG
ncbi:MAG: DHHA1 domain-containing protein, partial [Gammaproteobacteria bacterium]